MPRATTTRSRTTPGKPARTGTRRKPSAKSTTARSKRRPPHRFGPLFFTVAAVTGLGALAFLGLVASMMPGV